MTVIRRARPADLPEIAQLAAEHAEFEKAAPPAPGLDHRLHEALFGPSKERLRVHCLVAEEGGSLVGYATCVPEFATWAGTEYLHMDCLYLRPGRRGRGVGRRLVEAVVARATALGLSEIQWNTPAWNEGAVRFYDRLGARPAPKFRYTFPVSSPELPPPVPKEQP